MCTIKRAKLVDLVCLVHLVHLVNFVQPNKQNKLNKQEKPAGRSHYTNDIPRASADVFMTSAS
jgi:hypothetical protein